MKRLKRSQMRPGEIFAIQACAGSSHAERRAKVLNEPRLAQWIAAGGRFEIWSWSKRANGRWELRAEDMAPAIRAMASCVEARSEA